MTLDELRNKLSVVDRHLVELIAERQKIVGEIGKSKLETGTGTRDYAREKDVLDMGREQDPFCLYHQDSGVCFTGGFCRYLGTHSDRPVYDFLWHHLCATRK